MTAAVSKLEEEKAGVLPLKRALSGHVRENGLQLGGAIAGILRSIRCVSFVATSLAFFRQGIGPFRQPCLCHSRYRLERSMLREDLADELVNNAGNAPIQCVSAQTSQGPSRFQLRLPLLR